MQLPDHENLHGCVKVILGDILECSIVDIFVRPLGSRIHACWDTIIAGERRTIRMTFDDKPGRGSAQTQLEEHRPVVQSAFESEERARAKYGEHLPMPAIPDKCEPVSEALEAAAEHGPWRPSMPPNIRLLIVLAEEVKRLRKSEWDLRMERSAMASVATPVVSGPEKLIRAIEAELKRVEARTGSPLFDAGTYEGCQRIREVIAAAATPDSNPSSGVKSTPSGLTNVREPMPYIVPGAVRVCAHSDAECSRGCGDGPCKRGDEGGAA